MKLVHTNFLVHSAHEVWDRNRCEDQSFYLNHPDQEATFFAFVDQQVFTS